MGLFGCGAVKYKLVCNSDFHTEKTSYAEGETVRVTYDLIATDTDYTFYTDSEDVELKQEYDNRHGYIFTFTMPAHDVTLSVTSRNSMEMDPEANPQPASPEDYISDEHMQFDYYEAIVATVGGDESKEFVLYEYVGDQLILAQYNKREDNEETMDYHLVPLTVLDDCMALVKQYKMSTWKEGTGLRGKLYAVRFPENGEMKRVSSDDMPENGQVAFDQIGDVLGAAWGAYRKDAETETWFCPACGTRNATLYCSECGLKKP